MVVALSSPPVAVAETSFVPYGIVAFGGSAGAIPALLDLLPRLPRDFPIPIVVVQHLAGHLESRWPEVLGFRSTLRCQWAWDGERLRPGFIYVAPPGRNLSLTASGTLVSVSGTKPRTGWPSVDIFLRSIAEHLGQRAIAVMLSGTLYDGAQGLWAVRRRGGATIVQHPDSALCAGMPSAAIDLGRADLILSLPAIAQALELLSQTGRVE